MADVSIITPTYNRLWSLPEAVASCYEEGLEIEVIVIDDGSTDGTAEWLSQQQNLTVISQRNQGKDHAVNNGFAVAKGKYIRFLDSDDRIIAGSTSALVAKAEADALDVTCAGYQIINNAGTVQQDIPWTVCDDFLAQQLGECDSSHYGAYLFKKEFIKDIPHRQEYASVDDRQFVIEVAFAQPKVGYIGTPALAHRVHDKERLQDAQGLQKAYNHWAYYRIFTNALSRLRTEGKLSQRYKNAIAGKFWHLAHWAADHHLDDAYKIYQMIYELSPDFRPTDNLGLAKAYKALGFTATERLLKFKRKLGL